MSHFQNVAAASWTLLTLADARRWVLKLGFETVFR
ncbi:hypothetical protein GGR34_000633 [Microvirga flocculans]|uniref:Uncharacterized protein n=1 Tax=Microvirga flocculans TaxID=217168 RepID=A0A7W6N6H9_9HYPH|nr:hypothetical protein [Microvirga flocculans]